MTLRSSLPLVALLVPASAWSQAPAGPPFQVNVYTTGIQSPPQVAADRAGNFIVVWPSLNQDGDNWGVFGRRFDSGGVPLGGEFQVNTYTTGAQGSLGDLAVAVSPQERIGRRPRAPRPSSPTYRPAARSAAGSRSWRAEVS